MKIYLRLFWRIPNEQSAKDLILSQDCVDNWLVAESPVSSFPHEDQRYPIHVALGLLGDSGTVPLKCEA